MNTTTTGKPTVDITCTEQAFPSFPNLLLGETTDHSAKYFDATAYFNLSGLSMCSENDFLTNYFHPIGALITAYGLDKDRVFVHNLEGHLLIDSSLIYLFICYTNPDFLAFLNDRVDELLSRGFCISDSYLFEAAKDRLPLEVFMTAIDNAGTIENN